MTATWQEMAQFEDWFPSSLSSHIGSYILNLLEDGFMEAAKLRGVVHAYLSFYFQETGLPKNSEDDINQAMNEALTVLLEYQSIEEFERENDETEIESCFCLVE